LNWQFQFAPVTSLMISGLPAPAPVLELGVLFPQPAAASNAAESAAASAKVLFRLTTVVLP
jgi:hypothetical protein